MKGVIGFVVVAILLAALANVIGTAGSVAMDTRDGGDAQVIRVVPPEQGVDQEFANTYKTIAEGNYWNAKGDATTTLANAQANQLYNGTWMGWVFGLAVLAIVLFLIAKGLGG
jgi:hypothetical protein